MIDKRLIGMMGDSKRYIAKNVALQWLALAANVAMIFAVSRYLGALYDQLTIGDTMAGAPNLPLTLGIVAAALLVRAACTRGAAAASYNASRTVKKTLRSAIYEKLLRLGGGLHPELCPPPRWCSWQAEGVEQLETYFGAYLPQFFYSHAGARSPCLWCCAPVSVKAAVVLMVCVPLIPVVHRGSAEICQAAAGQILGAVCRSGRHLPGKPAGPDHPEDLPGRRSPATRQMNREAEHFRKVTMKVLTMQLNSIIVMDVIAYGGAALGIGMAARELCGRSRRPEPACSAILLLSADFFLPMRAAGLLLPRGHERHGRQRQDLPACWICPKPPAGDCRSFPDAEHDIHCSVTCAFPMQPDREMLHGVNLRLLPRAVLPPWWARAGCGKSTIAAVLMGRAHGLYRQRDHGRRRSCRDVNETALLRKCHAVSAISSYLFKGHGGARTCSMAAPHRRTTTPCGLCWSR